jgi:hypothetical protein
VAITTVSSAKAVVVHSGVVGKSAVYRRYISGPGTLPWSPEQMLSWYPNSTLHCMLLMQRSIY